MKAWHFSENAYPYLPPAEEYESIRVSLPNRIYEGSLYGTVPIAPAGIETGRWLAKRGAGVILEEPVEQQLIDFFRYLDNHFFPAGAGLFYCDCVFHRYRMLVFVHFAAPVMVAFSRSSEIVNKKGIRETT